MDEQQLLALLQKVLAGIATQQEKEELERWYSLQNNKEVVWETGSPHEESVLELKMLAHLQQYMQAKKEKKHTFYLRPLMKGAAAALFLICAISAFFYFNRKGNYPLVQYGAVETPASATQNRYVLLPDSSLVLLRPGSHIKYDFSGKTRELTLAGEAFFDIRHQQAHPFVIHTGTVITTVLGTAFSIKTTGQKVIVMVTRGKVSVSDAGKKVRAVLTPNQQAAYNETTQSVSRQHVNSEQQINWVKGDMQFDEMPFKELAGRLSKRYGVVINFKNSAMEKCPITGKFNGTESLEEVLAIISQTTFATYSIDENKVIIDGKGCI